MIQKYYDNIVSKNFVTCLLLHQPVFFCSVMVHFIMPDGSKQTAKTKVGENLLDIIVDNDIDIDGFG